MSDEKFTATGSVDDRPKPGNQERPMTAEEKLETALEDTFPTSDPVPASHVDGPEVIRPQEPQTDEPGPAERKGLSPSYDDGVEIGETDEPLDDAGNPLNDHAGEDRR